MFPRFTRSYQPYLIGTDLILGGQEFRGLSGPATPNFTNLRFCEFSLTVRCSRCAGMARTSLGYHILCVIAGTSQKQMTRIATDRVIARVTDKLSTRIFAIVKEVGDAMCSQRAPSTVTQGDKLTLFPSGAAAARRHPRPAVRRATNVYFRPKTLFVLFCEVWKSGSLECGIAMFHLLYRLNVVRL